MKGRIIVVEDLPDVCLTIKRILEDDGYIVKTAESREGALEILQIECFHVAILDIRLDESDESNQDGIQLLRDINQLDPFMATIVFTGYPTMDTVYAALQPKNGSKLAYDYLQKKDGFDRLSEKVYSAFQESLKLNLKLLINDPDACIEHLAKNMRFIPDNKLDKMVVADQVREILCKLFFECEQITVDLMQQGFSGAAVFQVTPSFPNKGQGQNVVVKVGDKHEITSEILNYEKYVKGIVGGHRIPETIKHEGARHVRGIQYSFAGMDETTVNFSKFYYLAEIKDVLSAVDNLYKSTLFPRKQNTGRLRLRPSCDLKEFYMRHLHLSEEKLKKVEDRTTGAKHVFHKDMHGEILLNNTPVFNPIQYCRQAHLNVDSFFNTIHGDLNGQNILIDKYKNAWLIDFATTTDDGHILQDYATLENNVRFELNADEDINLLFKWTKLCLIDSLVDVSLSMDIQGNSRLTKAHQVIQRIRQFASETPYYTPRAYLTALFFNALRLSTFNTVSPVIRDHAFYCASIIAERFSKGVASV